MDELRLARRKGKRKGAGEGRTALPLKRRYVREVIEQKNRGGDNHMGKQRSPEGSNELWGTAFVEEHRLNRANTRTPEEVEEIRATLAMPVEDRIARMERFIEGLDKEAAITGEGTPEMRLSGARLLDREAMRLTQGGDGRDYAESVRRVVGSTSVGVDRDEDDAPVRELGEVYGTDEQMREAVERRMRENPEEYPSD